MFDGYCLTCFSNSEFYLATTLCISCGITITPAEISRHQFILITLEIGNFNSITDIFIGNPNVPGPKCLVTSILNSNDGIPLSDGILIYLERYITIARTVIFNISNQIWCVLPYQFGFSRNTVSIFTYVRGGDCPASMIDEITQNIGSGWCLRGICRSVGSTIFNSISIYQRERIVSRSIDYVTVGSIFIR